ncbi:transposase [Rhizobium leguminosarum]|nr:transposase [Rhizobium leguminosarum]
MMRRAAIIDIARSFAILNAERRPHLADREPATANAGLLQQPQIEIVARDRGRGYAQTAAQALPHTDQVADRPHLMENANHAFLDAVRKSMRQVAARLG